MPKFGELLPTDVWAAAARTLTNPSGVFSDAVRTLTDLDLHDLVSYPVPASAYPIVTVTSSASADTFGSWTELVANVGAGKQIRGVWITRAHGFQVSDEIEIGVGAGGAESAIYRWAGRAYLRSDAGWFPTVYVPIDVLLADSARLSARVRTAQAAANDFYLSPVVV